MPDTVRVGIAGAGFVAAEHLAMLARVPGATVAGVHDLDPGRAAGLAGRAGALCRPYDDVGDLLDASDALFVCTWTSTHRALVEAAAARGVPVFCEKPLATTVADARAMAGAVAAAGVVNQVGLVLRYSPAFALLRSLVHDGRSGTIQAVSFRSDQYLPVRGHYASTWRSDVSRAGGGVLLEHSIHDLDILEWLLGEIVLVTAQTRHVHGLAGIEDVATVGLSFRSGVLGQLTTVWHDSPERPECRRVEVFGERLWACLDGNYHLGPVHWQWAGGPRQQASTGEIGRVAARLGLATDNEDEAFVNAVRHGTATAPGFGAAVRAQELVAAAYRSAERGGEPVATPAGG